MSSLTRNPRFSDAKIVLCIDVGTTFTAASYCLLQNKNSPKIFHEVNKWPRQLYSNAKIPSAIYYDQMGRAQILGAETEDMDRLYEAEEGGWVKAEWWKLHLRPEYLPLPQGFTTMPLPPLVTVDKAFEDLFAYVLTCVRTFIEKATGNDLLSGSLASSMFVVLTTPNGWEGQQQNRMRNAAIKAGLILDTHKDRMRFVSEGEAAVHYCLKNVPVYSLVVGNVVLVCDAGGGTTDIGIYKVVRLEPLFLEEIIRPRCIITGGVYVDSAANKLIINRLAGSRWGSEEIILKATKAFEKEGKRTFTGKEASVYLTMTESGESDQTRGIVRGRLKLTKEEMIYVFESAINRLTEGLSEVLVNCPRDISQAFVVGGFAESDYVFSKIAHFFQNHKIPAAKPDGSLSKAIAHGGLGWHFGSSVQVRMTRLHYGAETDVLFDEKDPRMAGRAKYKNVRGEWRVRHAWKCVVSKNTRIRTGQEHRECFYREVGEGGDLDVEMELFAYRLETPPMFYRDKDGRLVDGFLHLGTVKGDLSKCYKALNFRTAPGQDKKPFKTLEYEVGIVFGDTELSASLYWKQNGSPVFGEAVIAYDM